MEPGNDTTSVDAYMNIYVHRDSPDLEYWVVALPRASKRLLARGSDQQRSAREGGRLREASLAENARLGGPLETFDGCSAFESLGLGLVLYMYIYIYIYTCGPPPPPPTLDSRLELPVCKS